MKSLAQKHSRLNEITFRLKVSLLIIRRKFQTMFTDVKRFTDKQTLTSAPIRAVSESNLWSTYDNEQNWLLTAGKVQNLRIAAKRLHGIEIEANKTFSFWKHLGNPNIGKGYVVGREIKEGCIVPTIAGGLCQLSNALYDAALKANFQIIERHRHTKIIKGSLAEQDRDATVKWNYVDLRFKSAHSFRIEVNITSDKLIVTFRSTAKTESSTHDPSSSVFHHTSQLNDCYSCGNVECFKHQATIPIKQEKEITTFILDDKWSEYDDYLKTNSTHNDFFIVPLFNSKFIKTNRYNWSIKEPNNVKTTPFAALHRALQLRLAAKMGRNAFASSLRLDQKVAKAAANMIPIESTHLVISQNLLPFLFEQGALGGRTFDVLMCRLPMERLHQRLDAAHQQFPESKTLHDFRASQSLIDLENKALTKARHIITPHSEIAEAFKNKAIKLSWILPAAVSAKPTGEKILFPAPALGRKGAYALRQLAKELNLSVVVAGKASEDENFWDGVRTVSASENLFNEVRLVVYPTYVEHQPRLLLKALAMGIPVIATTACGLSPTNNLTLIPIGDYDALKQAVTKQMEQ